MPTSLSGLISHGARHFPDRPAVLGAAPRTYAALDREVTRVARRLAERDIVSGRVGLLLPNLPLFPAAFFGIVRAGASALLLNPLLSPREVAEQLADAGARDVVTTPELAGLLPAGARALLVEELAAEDGGGDYVSEGHGGETGGRGGPASTGAFSADTGAGGEDGPGEAAVIYTSAMDGWARGARLTHRSLLANARATVQAMEVGPGDVVLAPLPLIHAFGLTVTMNAPLLAGGAILPVERFHPVRMLELLEESGATVVCGVPSLYGALLSAAERSGAPAHRLRLALCGGAPLRPEVARRWEEVFGIPLREGYGLTEASPVCLFNRADRPNRIGTMGVAFPGVEVTIRDTAGAVLPPGEVGEICVEGENVFAGYVGAPAREPDHFFGSVLRTGDLGRMDRDGSVRFRGCLKRMFTRNGFNVYPREIERVLEEDPRVARATATALPDLQRENEIALAILPAPNATLDEAAVRQLCREVLAAYKQPSHITLESPEAEAGRPAS